MAVCLALVVYSTSHVSAQGSDPIRVQAKVRPGSYYVGQAIELTVSAVAGAERPEVVAPKISGATVTPTSTDFKPISTSSIGSLVAERNLYVSRFRVLPLRSGNLTIPAILARLGGRSGRSVPIKLTIVSVPVADRPAEFLGGVGTFELKAEASPATVRMGQELEYRIIVTGPAARGMSEIPRLRRFDELPVQLRIDPAPSEAVADPPSRVFKFRLRPTRAGDAALPPVTIAAYDPKIERYVTKVTSSVLVRVLALPKFDPATLTYAIPTEESGLDPARLARWASGVSAGLLALALFALVWARRIRARRSRGWRTRRLISRVVRELDQIHDAAEAGRRVTEGLAAYLRLAVNRPLGALTPLEAEQGIVEATGSMEFSERFSRLIAVCDRAQFAGGTMGLAEMVPDARELFRELERREADREGSGEASPEKTGRGSQGHPDGIDGARNLPLQNSSQANLNQPITHSPAVLD